MKRPLVVFCSVAAAALITACGGGGGTSPVPPGPGSSSGNGTVQFSITVPNAPPASSGARRPNFTVPSNTQSVAIALTSVNGSAVSGSQPTIANLSASTSGCAASSSGLTCTVSVTAPAGTDVFNITTYGQTNGQGTVLGEGNVSVTTQAGQSTTAPTTLSGTVASVSISVLADVPLGVNATVPVTIVAKDANGNAIIGTYSSPLTLSDTDASNQTSLSGTSVPDSMTGAGITMTYKGGAMSAPAVIGATVSGVSTSNISPANFSPDAHYPTAGQTNTLQLISTSQLQPPTGTPRPQSTFSGVETATYNTGATFNNISGLVDLHETFSTNTSAFDDYYKWTIGNTATLAFVGSSSSGSTATSDVCQAPYAPIWETGVSSWQPQQGTGPCTSTTASSSDTDVTTGNADGSYTDVFTFSGEVETTVEHSDGSVFQTFNNNFGSSVTVIYTPAPDATSIPMYLQQYSGPLPSPLPSPVAANTSEPNWYAAVGLPHGVPQTPLDTDVITVKGTASLPSSCAVPSSVLGANPQIVEVDEQFSILDAGFGFYFTGVNKIYTLNGIGQICVVGINRDSFQGGESIQQSNVAYVTQSTLKAAMASTRSFAQALPAAEFGLMADVRMRLQQELMKQRLARLHRGR